MIICFELRKRIKKFVKKCVVTAIALCFLLSSCNASSENDHWHSITSESVTSTNMSCIGEDTRNIETKSSNMTERIPTDINEEGISFDLVSFPYEKGYVATVMDMFRFVNTKGDATASILGKNGFDYAVDYWMDEDESSLFDYDEILPHWLPNGTKYDSSVSDTNFKFSNYKLIFVNEHGQTSFTITQSLSKKMIDCYYETSGEIYYVFESLHSSGIICEQSNGKKSLVFDDGQLNFLIQSSTFPKETLAKIADSLGRNKRTLEQSSGSASIIPNGFSYIHTSCHPFWESTVLQYRVRYSKDLVGNLSERVFYTVADRFAFPVVEAIDSMYTDDGCAYWIIDSTTVLILYQNRCAGYHEVFFSDNTTVCTTSINEHDALCTLVEISENPKQTALYWTDDTNDYELRGINVSLERLKEYAESIGNGQKPQKRANAYAKEINTRIEKESAYGAFCVIDIGCALEVSMIFVVAPTVFEQHSLFNSLTLFLEVFNGDAHAYSYFMDYYFGLSKTDVVIQTACNYTIEKTLIDEKIKLHMNSSSGSKKFIDEVEYIISEKPYFLK